LDWLAFPGDSLTAGILRETNPCEFVLGDPGSWPLALTSALGIVLNASAPMLLCWDLAGAQSLFYNDAFAPLMGCQHPRALGKSLRLLNPELKEKLARGISKVFTDGRPHQQEMAWPFLTTASAVNAHGEAYYNLAFSPIMDTQDALGSRVAGVLVLATETTRAVFAERRQVALDSLQSGLFCWYPKTQRLSIDDTLRQCLAVPQHFGNLLSLRQCLSCIHPEDRAAVRQAIRAQADVLDVVFRVLLPDGDLRWLHLRGKAVEAAPGEAVTWVGACTEVTERKLKDDALQVSESRFKTLAAAPSVVLWMTGGQTPEVTFTNETWHQWTGQTPEDMLGHGWHRVIHPDDLTALSEAWFSAFDHRRSVVIQFRLVHLQTGQIRHVLSSGMPRYDEQGAFLGYVGSLVDLTDEKSAEAALRSSREQLRQLANALPALVWGSDPEGSITFLNDRWAEYTGQSIASGLGNGWAEMLHPDDRPRLAEAWQVALETGQSYEIEARFYHRPTEQFRWMLIRALPVRDAEGRITGWYGTDTDIEERKRTEASLAQALERFNLINRATNDAIWDWDLISDQLSWNEAVQRMFQYPADAIGDTIDWWYEQIHPEDRQRVVEGIHAVIDGGGQTWCDEYRFICGDGTCKTVVDRGFVVRDETGRPLRMLGSMIDMTERLQAALALRESQKRFLSTFEQAAVGIAQVGATGRFLLLNRRYCEILGYSHDELKALTFQEITHPDDVDSDVGLYEQLKRKEIPHYSLRKRYIHKDGHWVWVNLTVSVVWNEQQEFEHALAVVEDITQQVMNESRVKRLEESNSLGVFYWHIDGAITYANDAFLATIGYSREDLAAGRLSWKSLTPSDFWEADLLQMEVLRQTGRLTGYEKPFIRKDGSLVQVHLSAAFLDETQQEGVTVSLDMTERNRAQAALQESETRFRTLADASPVLIWMCGPDGGITYLNETWSQFTGIAAEQAMGFDWTPLIHPDDLEATLNSYQKAISARTPWTLENRLKHRDGSWRWMSIAGRPRFTEEGDYLGHIGVLMDVTERKEAELQTQESRERLQAALNAARTGTFRWDIKTGQLSCDENLDRLFGLAPGQAPRTADAFYRLVHPEDQPAVIALTERCAQEGVDFNLEFRVIWPDGSVHWLDDKAQTYRDEQGQPAYMTGACVDITESRQARQALEIAEERLRYALSAAGMVGTFDWHLQTNLFFADPHFVAMFSADPSTVEHGVPMADILAGIHPDDFPRVQAAIERTIQNGTPYSEEYRLLQKDGTVYWVIAQGECLYDADGRPWRFPGAVVDITQRKQAELATLESEERFRTLANSVPTIVWMAKPDGSVNFMNNRWYEETGLSESATLGDHWRVVLHPDDYRRTLQTWQSALTTHQPYEMEHRLRLANGEYRWFVSRAYPQLSPQGDVKAWYGTSADIQDLKAAQAKAEEASRRKSQFLANMSHELRTPLNAVIGYADMLKQGFAGALSEKQTKYVGNIASNGRHLLAMVNDILDIAKAEAGKVELKVVHIELEPFTSHLLDMVSVTARQKQVQLHLNTQPGLDGLYADPDRLRQIFLNLMSNAIKFNREGGEVNVWIYKSPDRCWVNVEIQDTGIGISSDKIQKLFSEFYQVDSSLSRQYEGTGLGLALTRRLIELHGGRISVESEVGVGSTFRFTLPEYPTAASVAEETPDA
jgi:PAS domain S-box-containing protein